MGVPNKLTKKCCDKAISKVETSIYYMVHSNLIEKVIFMCTTSSRTALSATSQFDGNTYLVGKCTYSFMQIYKTIRMKICHQLDENLDNLSLSYLILFIAHCHCICVMRRIHWCFITTDPDSACKSLI
jgi:hypothetical protein